MLDIVCLLSLFALIGAQFKLPFEPLPLHQIGSDGQRMLGQVVVGDHCCLSLLIIMIFYHFCVTLWGPLLSQFVDHHDLLPLLCHTDWNQKWNSQALGYLVLSFDCNQIQPKRLVVSIVHFFQILWYRFFLL